MFALSHSHASHASEYLDPNDFLQKTTAVYTHTKVYLFYRQAVRYPTHRSDCRHFRLSQASILVELQLSTRRNPVCCSCDKVFVSWPELIFTVLWLRPTRLFHATPATLLSFTLPLFPPPPFPHFPHLFTTCIHYVALGTSWQAGVCGSKVSDRNLPSISCQL